MIKLIASDMDGTLLNDKKEMPEKTFYLIKELHKRGIKFTVASGRQHLSLLNLYDEIKDEITFVAGNGSVIIDKGEVISTSAINRDVVTEVLSTIEQIPGLIPTICGLDAVYMLPDNILSTLEDYLIDSHFPNYKIIQNVSEIPESEQILQIAIFDPKNNSRSNIFEPLKHLQDRCHLAVSGDEWLDIMAIGTNKGVAIAKLQAMLSANYEETMVFGDELNDYEMMQTAYYSYAMENAVAPIKEIANFVAPSNEDEGVIKIIENFLALTANQQ